MKVLCSLVSRARTVCAFLQAAVAFARGGLASLTPVQLLVLGCGLCIAVRILLPSPMSSGGKRAVAMDRLCSVIAAAAVIGLAVADAVGCCLILGRLTLGA